MGIEFIFYFLLISIVVYNMIVAKIGKTSLDYLSINNTVEIKGFFAIVVVFHHLTQAINKDASLLGLKNWGYLAVAVFFFYNGYGLMLKTRERKPYVSDFYRRILKILIPFAIMYFVYIVLDYCDGKQYSVVDIVKSLVNGVPIAGNLWYIIFLLFYYIVYWIIVNFCKGNKQKITIAIGVFLVIWLFFCIWRKMAYLWYVSNITIMLGLVWENRRHVFDQMIKKYYAVAIGLSAVVFVSMHVLFLFIHNSFIGYIFLIISSLFFVAFVLMYNMAIPNNSRLLRFTGKISFELYMIHGCFIKAFRSNYINIKNDYLFALLVLLCSFLAAYVFNLILKKISFSKRFKV